MTQEPQQVYSLCKMIDLHKTSTLHTSFPQTFVPNGSQLLEKTENLLLYRQLIANCHFWHRSC